MEIKTDVRLLRIPVVVIGNDELVSFEVRDTLNRVNDASRKNQLAYFDDREDLLYALAENGVLIQSWMGGYFKGPYFNRVADAVSA